MSPIPSSLDDRYVLDAVVAARGDAVTVTATDEILLRDVWITLLLEFDDERRAAFRQQAEALARRNVEGAPRVYDGSMRAALPYVVTQPPADGDPSALLDVLTDDDAPTVELPIIVKPPRPRLADTAQMAVTVPDGPAQLPGAAAAPTPPAAGVATRRRMVLAATAGILLLMGATAAVWATSDSDAPALAEQMPVVQGVDVTEEPTEPDPTLEAAHTEPDPEPAPEATTEEEAPPAPDPAPADVGPAAEPAPQEAAPPVQPAPQQKEKKEKSGGQGGPPDHAKAKGRDR